MNDIKKYLSVFAFTTFVIIALGFVASNATANDCSGEVGAAFGLCTAYCEAMDCDGSAGGPHANATACGKVEGKFTNITGMSLPCEGALFCSTDDLTCDNAQDILCPSPELGGCEGFCSRTGPVTSDGCAITQLFNSCCFIVDPPPA